MWFNELWQRWRRRPATGRPTRSAATRRQRLRLEQLEDRTLPSSYTAASVADLIADINAANTAGGANTITLVAGKTFTLTAVNNWADGGNGLPVIAANDNLTIAGNGDTIVRSAKATFNFRLLDVAGGAALTLEGGVAEYGVSGGAIYNQGTLTLNSVTVQNNQAVYGAGIYSSGSSTLQGSIIYNNLADAAGGGIYSSGSLTVQGGTIQNNEALGGNGQATGASGGDAFGGGIYIAGGTANLNNVTLYSNTAQGGNGAKGGNTFESGYHYKVAGGNGGDGLGGGLYVAGGTVSLLSTTVSGNTAQGGKGGNSPNGVPNGSDGLGEGGGLYIAVGASVYLDAFTLANIINNTASTAYPDIYGSYVLL